MKERPILFSAPMVRALLEGRKTQTRRVLKLPRWADKECPVDINSDGMPETICDDTGCLAEIPCPYGKPGDRLWVRENFAYSKHNTLFAADVPISEKPQENVPEWDWDATCQNRWRPSIHMPRKLCRITLEITSARVERVQDISEEDAKAEGVERNAHADGSWSEEDGYLPYCSHYPDGCECFPAFTARDSFKGLWFKINGKESWDANPWVWVVEFRKVGL